MNEYKHDHYHHHYHLLSSVHHHLYHHHLYHHLYLVIIGDEYICDSILHDDIGIVDEQRADE